jgi:multidrug efflux pump
MQPEDLLRLNAPKRAASLVPLSAFAHALGHRADADHPLQRLPGDAHRRRRRAGLQHRRGDDAEMERLAAQLPPGFGYEWTGQSREERLAGNHRDLTCSASRCWPCSCAWRRCTKAGRSRSR